MTLFQHKGPKLTPDRWRSLKVNTHKGQAYFAGTGPEGMQRCYHCIWWGKGEAIGRKPSGLLKAASCHKYRELAGEQGSPVPADASPCKFFSFNSDHPLNGSMG